MEVFGGIMDLSKCYAVTLLRCYAKKEGCK